MEEALHVVDEERKRVKAEFLDVQAKLGVLTGSGPRTQAIRAGLKARQLELQARLTTLKSQSRQLRGLPDRPRLTPSAEEAATFAITSGLEEIKALNERILQLKHDLHTAHQRIADTDELRERYEARVSAGMERRREMVLILNALLTCEDDGRLSEAEYDARMDAVVRRARTVISLEKAAILGRGDA